MTVTKPDAATPGVFTLTDEHVAAVNSMPAKGKPAVANEYVPAVLEAIKTGDQKGIAIRDDKHLAQTRNKLAAAAKFITKELDGEVARIKSRDVTHAKLGRFLAFTAHTEPVTPSE